MVYVLVCLLRSVGAARAGAILVEGKAAVVGLYMNGCKFENNAGQLSGAIAALIGTDLSGITPSHYTNTFINNNGLNADSAGAYYLAGTGNKKITFWGLTATGNQGGVAGFMYINSPFGTHAITVRDNPKATGQAPNMLSNNVARAGYAGPGGAGVLYHEGSSLTLAISYTTFTSNTGNRYGGVIGIQGGSKNVVNHGLSVTYTSNTIGPVGSGPGTAPFTGKTVVCAATAAPPAISGTASFAGTGAPSGLVSCFNVAACKDICTTDYNFNSGDKEACDTFCDELGGRSALSATSTPPKVEGTWVQNTTYANILANPSGAFICNDACWSEP